MADKFCTCSRSVGRTAHYWILFPVAIITCSLPNIHTLPTPAIFCERIKHMPIPQNSENGKCLFLYEDTYSSNSILVSSYKALPAVL